jgi:hypothetical protein
LFPIQFFLLINQRQWRNNDLGILFDQVISQLHEIDV